MDYFGDVLGTFLDLERGCTLVDQQDLSLICVLKINKGLMGFEQHEGE